MRWTYLALGAVGLVAAGPAIAAPSAVLAWFTDAEIADSVQGPAPSEPLPRAAGTNGPGVALARSAAVDNPPGR